MGIEIINDEVEFSGPGRPMQERATELYEAIRDAMEQKSSGFKCDLREDEVDKFYRFSQRCRSAAKRAGVKVNVSSVKGDPTKGAVRILYGASE